MSGLLQGIRIVELASWTYVPSAGAALSDWGAEVVKIEDTRGGDSRFLQAHTLSLAWLGIRDQGLGIIRPG